MDGRYYLLDLARLMPPEDPSRYSVYFFNVQASYSVLLFSNMSFSLLQLYILNIKLYIQSVETKVMIGVFSIRSYDQSLLGSSLRPCAVTVSQVSVIKALLY